MNFSLQQLESHLDEASLLHAEQLLDDERVEALQELEKHLWVAKVRDERVYEVEVKITPTKVSAATCDCNRYKAEKSCGHIAAVLFMLRQKQNQKPKKTKQTKQNTSGRLTTGVVLNEVAYEELVSFVKQYAKTNRNFALALKARFTPNVSHMDSREKYIQLLESTISAARRPDRTFNHRGGKKIYKVLLEIHHQIDEAIAQGYLAEAVTMAQTIIEKITPLLRKMEAMQDEIRQQIRASFEALRKVLNASPPQALRESIWAYSLAECRKLLYRNSRIDQYFFRLLMQMSDEPEQQNALLELLDDQITRYFFEKRELAQLLLIKLSLLEKLDRTDEVQAFINQYITNDEVLTFAVRQAMHNDNLHRAKILAQSGLENTSAATTVAAMENTLLEIAILESDQDSIQHYAERQLVATLDLAFYKIIKKYHTTDWTVYRTHLLQTLQHLSFSIEKMRLIAAIYYEEGLHKELLVYLQDTKSLDLAKEFGTLLLPFDPQGVYAFYNELFDYYLSNHVGRKPSEKIRAIIRQLHEADAEDLAENLVENLRRKFPERHSLMEELEVF